MHTRHCLKIADRIHLLLVRELGQGLDRQRMLREPLYARDVLLVCDALRLTGAPFLAMHFRRCAASPDEAEQAAARRAAAKGRGFGAGLVAGINAGFGSGFSASRFLNSLFVNSLFGNADAATPGQAGARMAPVPSSGATLRPR